MNTQNESRIGDRRSRPAPLQGNAVIWPAGLRARYGISPATQVRWERAGKLPARDVFVGGRAVGWRPETLERAERGISEANAA